MGVFNPQTYEEKLDFAKTYLPVSEGFTWRFALPEETLPFDAPTASCFGLTVGHFVEGGLSLPLDPMFLEFMNSTNIPFSRLGMNIIRTFSTTLALNRKLRVRIELPEIAYCNRLNLRGDTYYYLSYQVNKMNSPELIKGLHGSFRGVTDRPIVITGGPVLPPGRENYKFPKFTDRMVINFPQRPNARDINWKHLNIALGHKGYISVLLTGHARAYHKLLGLEWRYKTVHDRKNCEPWVVSEMTPEEKVVAYAWHGVENTASRYFEEQNRSTSHKGGPGQAECTELIRKVDATREDYRAYWAGVEREAAVKARDIRIRMTFIKEVGWPETATEDEILEIWGFYSLPLDITPISAFKREKAGKKAVEKAPKAKTNLSLKMDPPKAAEPAKKADPPIKSKAAGKRVLI